MTTDVPLTRGAEPIIIGLVSDTHGLLRDDVLPALDGVSLVLHAGDVGGEEILDGLGTIAPVQAVFGNVDYPGPRLSQRIVLKLGGLSVHVSHGHELGSPTPERLLARYAADIIIYGHTHRPLVHRAGERLVVNPGAAGPRRFNLRPSVARLTIADGRPSVQLIDLAV
jgi:putative phosphoesterase